MRPTCAGAHHSINAMPTIRPIELVPYRPHQSQAYEFWSSMGAISARIRRPPYETIAIYTRI